MVGESRRAVQEIKHSAISHSTENLFLQIDSMDNSKSYLPRYLEHAKEYQGTERLPTKITGGLIHSGCYQEKRKVMLFINHEQVLFTNYAFLVVAYSFFQYENASNMVITIINILLEEFL